MKIFENILKRHIEEYDLFEQQKEKWKDTKFDWNYHLGVELNLRLLENHKRNKGLDEILLYIQDRGIQEAILDFEDAGWNIKNPKLKSLTLDDYKSTKSTDVVYLESTKRERFYPYGFSSEGRAIFEVYERTSNSLKFYEIPVLNKILNLELDENILEWTIDDISFLKLSI